MNEVYSALFGSHKPARSTVAVAGLALDAKIEIECVALAGQRLFSGRSLNILFGEYPDGSPLGEDDMDAHPKWSAVQGEADLIRLNVCLAPESSRRPGVQDCLQGTDYVAPSKERMG